MQRINRLPFIVPALVFALFVLGACGGGDAPSDDTPAAALPQERLDTLEIEGQREPVALQLFTHEELPAAFYYPVGDFDPELVPSPVGFGVHFTATFGGVRTEEAAMRFFFPAIGTELNNPNELRTLVEEPGGIAEIEGIRLGDERVDAACEPLTYCRNIDSTTGQTGYIGLGSNDDQWYLVIIAYPVEFGDGFGPRARLLLDRMEWVN